jgi:glucose-6-phosphate 1-dehydrogenase
MSLSETVQPRKADPCTFVVFGATGDLTRRLLTPALYNLAAGGLLPEGFALVGFGRSPQSSGAFRDSLLDGLRAFATRPVDPAVADRLLSCATYVQGDIDDPQSYERLRGALEQVEHVHRRGCNRLFYLALPPNSFAPTVDRLHGAGLTDESAGCGWRHVIIEKPFGTDLASAQALNRHLLSVLNEEQIYRIDHYLGKETVQNIMVLRFANGLFEPIWNRNHIDHVQITVAETVTVERRGRFYDGTGALRDMVPNHLFQLLSLIAMEPPSRFDARSVRSEKAAALDAVRIPTEADARRSSVRAQYAAGMIKGVSVTGYRSAPDVRADSATETYAALKLEIDNWRWAGVPFYLRTGKALAARRSEVAVKFKQAPYALFRDTPVEHLAQNFLVLRIQPDEGITLHFNAKVPGPAIAIDGVGMTFKYKDYFDAAPSTGYETLIYDCMIGDATLFQRADAVEAGWRIVQPFLDAWSGAGGEGLASYPAGSEGPGEADALLQRDRRRWRAIGS